MAILFADVSGSMRIYESLGDALARDILARVITFMTDQTHQFDGRVVKTIGDEVMAVFPSAERALHAACGMQRGLSSPLLAQSFKPATIRIRVGFHFGAVICENEDVFGDAVNVAARMGQAAKADQILTTVQTLDLVPRSEGINRRIVDRVMVKGKQDPVDIYEVMWEEKDATVLWTNSIILPPSVAKPRLRLRYLTDHEIELGSIKTSVSLGRGPTNDVIINSPSVSRTHAVIELRKGKLILKDQSTNGTYVRDEQQQVELVRRDELTLNGKGLISLGLEPSKAKDELVSFEVFPIEPD
jgi:class 3 adenylate cyclase